MVCRVDLGRVNHLEPTPVSTLGTHCGDIGVFSVYANPDEIAVIDRSVKPRQCAGELCARTVMTISTHTVRRGGIRYTVMGYTLMDRRYRGCGISAAVYELAAHTVGPIMSGSAQSPGGRAIWNSLVKRGKLTVAALWKGEFWECEATEFGEVDTEHFSVYNTASRLVAA